MKNKRNIVIISSIFLALAGCEERFTPEGLKQVRNKEKYLEKMLHSGTESPGFTTSFWAEFEKEYPDLWKRATSLCDQFRKESGDIFPNCGNVGLNRFIRPSTPGEKGREMKLKW